MISYAVDQIYHNDEKGFINGACCGMGPAEVLVTGGADKGLRAATNGGFRSVARESTLVKKRKTPKKSPSLGGV